MLLGNFKCLGASILLLQMGWTIIENGQNANQRVTYVRFQGQNWEDGSKEMFKNQVMD